MSNPHPLFATAETETETNTEVEINVLFRDSELIIEQTDQQIDDLESVRWNFVDLPAGWVPGILFFQSDELHTGPFEGISVSPGSVVGFGNQGRIGRFEYIAIARDWREPRLSVLVSPPAELRQGPLVVQVNVDLSTRKFSVDPLVCKVAKGESVCWKFSGLGPRMMAEVRFLELTPPQGAAQPEQNYFGPFESIIFRESGIEGSGLGEVGRHNYDVNVVSLDANGQGLESELVA